VKQIEALETTCVSSEITCGEADQDAQNLSRLSDPEIRNYFGVEAEDEVNMYKQKMDDSRRSILPWMVSLPRRV
jgi:hypothetical protein